MKRTIGLVVCVLLLVAADEKDKDKEKKADDKKAEEKKVEKKDEKKAVDPVQGTWSVLEMASDGKESKVQPDHKMIFKDGRVTIKLGSRVLVVFRYKVDVTQKPAAIDVTIISGLGAGSTMKGIVQIKDDEMKYALAMGDEADRPTEFAPARFVLYYVLKRDK
jgi:uncharacterized protein (TIGR03067 family)